MDIKYIMTNMVVLGILLFAIISFVIIIQNDGEVNSENKIINNTLINDSYGDLEVTLNQQNSSQGSLNSLEDVPPQESVGDLDVASIVSSTRTAKSIITGLWNILIKLPMIILGVSSAVASAITSILLIIIAIGIWAIWKGAIS